MGPRPSVPGGNVTVQTVINARQNLDLSVETALDGSATLEVVYL